MRTTLSLKIPKRSVTPLIAVLLLTGTVSLGTACDDDKDYSRREHIEWSNSPEFEEALTGTLHIPVRASKEQDATPFKRSIYIRSNVAYQVGFEGEKEESGELPAEEWLNVDEIKRGVRPGIDELVLLITPHTESYVERKGCISLHTDVEFLNEFIAVVQGFPKYTKDYEGNFDWLKYGSAEPLETRGETPIDSWTADQKKMGLESTPAQEGGTAYCYGKNGYVKLGDDAGHGANLLTPYDPGIRNDTAAMVRFNAIAYATADGTKDNDELTVRITGGGQFADGTRENRPCGTPRSHGCGASDGHVEKLPAGVHHLLPPQKSLYEQHAHGTDGRQIRDGERQHTHLHRQPLRAAPEMVRFRRPVRQTPLGTECPATLKTQTTTYDEKILHQALQPDLRLRRLGPIARGGVQRG